MKKKYLPKPFFGGKMVPVFLCVMVVQLAFMITTTYAQAQLQLTITGKVIDAATGEPLPGTTILVEGTSTGVVTDVNGQYALTVPNENAVLVFSSIGYASEKTSPQGKTQIDVKLIADVKKLEEIVVVGYGKQSRAKITGAVSAVSSKDLEGREVRAISQALQGKAPGLAIASTSGQPGSEGISLNIRGRNSWGTGNSPLVLIDGTPGDMDVLSPDIVENITVLKDASSAAIYGARAANGVILITTKRGAAGKIQVTYNSIFSTQKPTMKYESVQDPVEFMELYNTAEKNTAQDPNYKVLYPDERISLFKNGTYKGTNWNDYMYENNLVQEHRVNLSGGSDNTKFNAGFSYLDQPGIIRNFGYNRYTYFGNFDLNVNKYISAGGGMSYTRGNMHEPSWGVQNIMILSLVAKPTYNPTYVDPTTGETKIMRSRWKDESKNASLYDQLENLGQHTKMSDILNLQAFINITPLKGLVWQTKVATYYTHDYDKTFKIQDSNTWYEVENTPATTYDPASTSLTVDQPWSQTNTVYSTLTYSGSIAGKHNISVMAGYEFDNNKNQTMSAYRRNYSSTDLQEINVGSSSTWTNGGSSSEWGLQSFFGRVNYDFADKYMIEGVIRDDNSSRFRKGFKASVFPSVSLGWRISKETFMKSLPWVSDLKFRASWGQLGNQDIGNYPYQATYSFGNNYYFGSLTQGVAISSLVNRNLSWETTTVKNIGFDLNIKNGLFTVTAEYYNKLTTDILRTAQVMATAGLNAPTINNGSMRNSGIELIVGHKKQINNKLNYWVNANIAFNKNRVVSFGSQEIDTRTIRKEGEEYDAWYLRKMVGIYQENDPDLHTLTVDGQTQHAGQIKYEDTDKDGNITSNDRQVVGHRYPVATFGINLGAQYGNFDFSAFIYGVQGYDGYMGYFGFEPFVQGAPPHVNWAKYAWTPENKSNIWPQVYCENNAGGTWYGDRPSTFFLQDLSYIRLKNIQIGYNFPASLLKSTPIKSARIYFSGENLLSFYNNKYIMVDPETQQDGSYYAVRYPQLKTFSFGLTVKF